MAQKTEREYVEAAKKEIALTKRKVKAVILALEGVIGHNEEPGNESKRAAASLARAHFIAAMAAVEMAHAESAALLVKEWPNFAQMTRGAGR